MAKRGKILEELNLVQLIVKVLKGKEMTRIPYIQ
jgi:hypothetical protein